MIADLSSRPMPSGWVELQNRRTLPMIDYEAGAEVLNTPSGELNTRMWVCDSDGTTVRVYRDDVPPVNVLTDTGITQVSLGFDQTMRPHIAYVAGGVAKFYWYDTLTASMQTMLLPGAVTPRLCMDEKRAFNIGNSDLILGYMKGEDLCVRYQRERFDIEHIRAANTGSTFLTTIGMNTDNRLQYKLRPKRTT